MAIRVGFEEIYSCRKFFKIGIGVELMNDIQCRTLQVSILYSMHFQALQYRRAKAC